jgi:hypothetical protein
MTIRHNSLLYLALCLALLCAVATADAQHSQGGGGRGSSGNGNHGNKCLPVVRTQLGSMSRFSLSEIKPLVYRMRARGVLLQNFTKMPETLAVLSFDAANKRAYVGTYGTLQWFFANGTYTYVQGQAPDGTPYELCMLQVVDGTFQDVARHYSGLLHANTFEVTATRRRGHAHDDADGGDDDSDEVVRLRQYVGHITITTNPHAVVMTLDDKGIIHTMDATGPQNYDQILGGVYSISYTLSDYAAIGTKPWAKFPSLPAACAAPLPFMPCLLSPTGCPSA